MKELSIEEKAKAYDEALKCARIYYTNGDKDMKMMMKTCFPVLVEKNEDERMRKIISDILLVDSDEIREILDTNNVLMQDIDAWLEKQGEQNSAWGEEDENMIRALNACIDVVIKSGMNYISFDSKSILIGKVKNWVKSIRAQNTWKPSDEQMERLKGTINSLQYQEILYSLYQDLKKLREE